MTEAWRPVAGYETTYEVSSTGRVRSVDRTDALGRRKSGVMLKLWRDPKGRLHAELQGKRHTVSRLVLEAFVGPAPVGTEGCHNDGNPSNNQLGNLRWGSRSSNTRDAVKHGTNACTKRTHCPEGHPLTEGNLVKWHSEKLGHRACLICHRSKSRASWQRRHGSLGAQEPRP